MKPAENKNYDYMAKVLIIGDSGVGKTNILMRLCDNNFMPSHLMTIGFLIIKGIDFKIKMIEVEKKKLKMQIWDTAGKFINFRTGKILNYHLNLLQGRQRDSPGLFQ
jgi:Ras-related protein Rab-8A